MRLHANDAAWCPQLRRFHPAYAFEVYFGPMFEKRPGILVAWVDDQTKEYGTLAVIGQEVQVETKRARRLTINVYAKCVFILD
jgi:hypothetical protein